MIRARCYRHGVAEPEEIAVADVPQQIDAEKGAVWIDCDDPMDQELHQLLADLKVNEFAREDIEKAGQRTKLTHYSGAAGEPPHFHVTVYDCMLLERGLAAREVDVVFAAGWLISVHQQPEGQPSDSEMGEFPADLVGKRFDIARTQHERAEIGLLLWALLDVVVDRYFVVTDTVDDRLDEIEAAVLKADSARRADVQYSFALFSLGKALVRFRRAAVPLRDVTAEIARKEVECISSLAVVHFQDLADHVLRVSDFVESQRDVITGLRDAELATASNRLSRSQQQIAAWGAIFIVATLITGVLGMNFKNAPELDWETGFLTVFGIMVLCGVPIWIYFKRKDWI
jgi:magnesium transporter